MAKKITISFSEQPVINVVGFSYIISLNDLPLFYEIGVSELKVDFIANGSTPTNYYELPIGIDLEDTLQRLLTFLREVYVNNIVSYNKVNNTIEVIIQQDVIVTVGEELNDKITISVTDIEPFGVNLIYFLIFDDYVLNIYKNNFQGTPTEVFGSFTITKNTVDSILSPIRGSGLKISLEASKERTFDEFILNEEFTFKTELIKSGNIIYEGYIKPDGVQQSYVNDLWFVNVESTDGLGALKDLSFVKQDGLNFTGKISLYDVIKGCLDRTKLSLTINTSIEVEYVGYTGTNILKDVFVNSSRYIKNENDTVIMDCNEVLTSILNLFSAVITQHDGKWWVYRPNDLKESGYITFVNQDTETTFVKNLNYNLGSQIDNYYPHHSGSNQQIEVKGAISAYRLNYEYGFLNGFVDNPNLNHDADMVFADWDKNPSLPINIEIIDTGEIGSGLEMIIYEGSPQTTILTSNNITAEKDDQFTFKTKVSTLKTSGYGVAGVNFTKVQFIFKIITSDGYYLNGNNQWTLTDSFIRVKTIAKNVNSDLSYTLEMPPFLNNCTFTIEICEVRLATPSSRITAKITYVDVVDATLQKAGIKGEFHTVSRLLAPSSITKENQKVYNGDGGAELIGSFFKDDLETLTTVWTRKNKYENLPLLGISAMDDLRIQPNPIKVFSGDIYGYIPYLSVVSINNIVGNFMFIEYDYDVKTNIINYKLLQFYNSDLADIQYLISPNYGENTIKPTIKS